MLCRRALSHLLSCVPPPSSPISSPSPLSSPLCLLIVVSSGGQSHCCRRWCRRCRLGLPLTSVAFVVRPPVRLDRRRLRRLLPVHLDRRKLRRLPAVVVTSVFLAEPEIALETALSGVCRRLKKNECAGVLSRELMTARPLSSVDLSWCNIACTYRTCLFRLIRIVRAISHEIVRRLIRCGTETKILVA